MVIFNGVLAWCCTWPPPEPKRYSSATFFAPSLLLELSALWEEAKGYLGSREGELEKIHPKKKILGFQIRQKKTSGDFSQELKMYHGDVLGFKTEPNMMILYDLGC